MRDIAHRPIVLKLNKGWHPLHVEKVSKSICDLMMGVIVALDIQYPVNEDGTTNFDNYEYINPVTWDEWITLPVRPGDLCLHSAKMSIRVPTVVITNRYSKAREKSFKGKPTKEGLFIRDNGRDGYTGDEIEFDDATIDHVIPRSRGGEDSYENTVLTTKEINNKKGNRLNSEAGLSLVIIPTKPKSISVSKLILKVRHQDWSHFIKPSKPRN